MASFTVALKSWVSSTFAPLAHASRHATAGADPITPAAIGAATAAQGSTADSAAQKASNLSDLANAATARVNLGLGDSATKAVGTTAGTVAAGNDSRITGEQPIHLSHYLDPARVEGVTDDGPALAAAVAALPATGGAISWGTTNAHILTRTTIAKPVTFIGAHRSTSRITVHATKLIDMAASGIIFERIGFFGSSLPDGSILFYSDKTVAANNTDWTFRDCLFSATGCVRFSKIGRIQTNGTPATLGTDLASGLRLIDCEMTAVRDAYTVEIAGVDDVLVQGCHIHDSGISDTNGEGLKLLHSASNVRIIGNHIHHNTRDGLDAYDATAVTIADNDIHHNGVMGVEVKWATTDAHTVDRLIFTGNRIYNNGSSGANVSVPYATIVGNVVTNNVANGIRVGSAFDSSSSPTDAVIISGNVTNSNGADGILLGNAVRYVTISSNVADSNTGSGISIGSLTSTITVNGNQARGNGSAGITVNGANVSLWGNRTQDADGEAYIGTSATNVVRPVLSPAHADRYQSSIYYAPRGGRSAFAAVLNQLTVTPIVLDVRGTLDRIATAVTVGGSAGSVIRLGIYNIGADGSPTTLLLDAGTVDATVATNLELTISQPITPGVYGLAAVAQVGTPTVRTLTGAASINVGGSGLSSVLGSSNSNTGFYQSGVSGALPATFVRTDRLPAPTLCAVRVTI